MASQPGVPQANAREQDEQSSINLAPLTERGLGALAASPPSDGMLRAVNPLAANWNRPQQTPGAKQGFDAGFPIHSKGFTVLTYHRTAATRRAPRGKHPRPGPQNISRCAERRQNASATPPAPRRNTQPGLSWLLRSLGPGWRSQDSREEPQAPAS